MKIPLGFSRQGEKKVCRLIKSLYGLKQATRQRNAKLCDALTAGGFVQSKFDYSLFTKHHENDFVIVLAYVDDLVTTGNNVEGIEDIKAYLHKNLKMKDLGPLKYFLGIEIAHSSKGLLLNQRKYTLYLLLGWVLINLEICQSILV